MRAYVDAGLQDASGAASSGLEELQTSFLVEGSLGRAAVDGDSPVDERNGAPEADPKYHGARETLWEVGGTTLQG